MPKINVKTLEMFWIFFLSVLVLFSFVRCGFMLAAKKYLQATNTKQYSRVYARITQNGKNIIFWKRIIHKE